ncbi:MAG: type VI secretion system tip protein VgrG [Polyangiaceae bacterium]|nr:type VI secretion system tip protein VgrG [Polyangiaceae bacterium]
MSAKVEFKLLGETLPADNVPAQYDLFESLSTPYEALVTFSTKDAAFKPSTCLRSSMTLHVIDADRGRERSLTGICDRCEFVHHEGTQFIFRLRLVPPIAALAHREDCRIYQDKGPVDVIKELLAAAGVEKVEWRLRTEYPKREYIVQYRETELEFMHRLMEEEGIFYFFSHEEGEATMVLSDSTEAIAEELKVPTVLAMSAGMSASDSVVSFSVTKKIATSNVQMRDFDFEKPDMHPESAQAAAEVVPQVYYEYPGGFTKGQDGERRVAARLRELRANAELARGTTNASNIEVGKMVTVTGAVQEILNRKYIVTELRSRGRQSLSGGGAAGAEGQAASNTVENDFVAMPEAGVFSAPRKTKKPRIHGLQTAMVTGPSMGEEEIHTDKYGRVKVRFRWDRVSQHDDKSSCWLRVMQAPLGGQMIIPRVGWEVSVAFLDGDPDRPFVLGRLYNAERTPPYALPGTKASGSIRSASSPGGAGANEIKLGDSGGSQGFGMTAQKDLNVTVGNDQAETVGANDATTVKVNASRSVGSNQSVSVSGNQETNVGSVASANVTGNQSISVGGNAVDNAISNYVEKAGADRSYSVGGDMLVICNGVRHSIEADVSRSVGAVMLTGSVASISDTIGGNYDENISIAKLDVCKGPWNETVAGNKNLTLLAADLHISKDSYASSAGGMMTNLIGGLHYAKVAGDFTVKAPMITLLGATGTFKGGGSEFKLGGGPVLIKGSKVAIETALLVHLGTALKMGAG